MNTHQTIQFTDTNFNNEVLLSSRPALVDFWAPWCAPCNVLGPMIEELAERYGGAVKIGKLNVDDNPTTAARYKIRSIPTLLLVKGGEVVETLLGVHPKQHYEQALDQIIAG